MDSKTRLETAWSFKEPDRVPIELRVAPEARELPEAKRLVEFEKNEADNFLGATTLIDWGFFGLDSQYREEVIEDIPGDFKRIKRIHSTPAGEFYAITKHFHEELSSGDFHWERRYIHTLEEFKRLADAPRNTRPFNKEFYEERCHKEGNRGIVMAYLHHPLGNLVREADTEEVYIWLFTEKKTTHKFLENSNKQVVESILSLEGTGVEPVFNTAAYEMLIPPWMGKDAFEDLVFSYDKIVNDAIHQIGGRHRAHCHGNSGAYLKRFADMGIDSIEPLEPPPYGDNDLAEAKRTVGDRMLLSGNILGQDFLRMSKQDVRAAVKLAIKTGAPGGGFTLRGANAGGSAKNIDQVRGFLEKSEVYMDAALEFGSYPIKC